MQELETLTQVNLHDLVNAFGWQDRPALARIVRLIFSKTARDFAQQMMDELELRLESTGLQVESISRRDNTALSIVDFLLKAKQKGKK